MYIYSLQIKWGLNKKEYFTVLSETPATKSHDLYVVSYYWVVPGREADHSFPAIVKVEKMSIYASTLSYVFME
jgi:hypothetical protein